MSRSPLSRPTAEVKDSRQLRRQAAYAAFTFLRVCLRVLPAGSTSACSVASAAVETAIASSTADLEKLANPLITKPNIDPKTIVNG